MPKFRARQSGETLADYLKAKQSYELAQTGKTTVALKPGETTFEASALGEDQSVFRPGYQSEYWKTRKTFAAGLDVTPPTAQEEEQIKANIAKEMQSQIDAIVDMYGGLIAKEERAGEQMLGRARAVSARGGLGGTGMAEAGAEKARAYTAEQVKTLAAEREMKRGAVLEKISERAEAKIKFETEKAWMSQEKQLAYLKDVEVRAQEDMITLAETGTTLSLLKTNKEVYQQLFDESGLGSELLFDSIYEANLPKPQQLDYSEIQYRGANGNLWLKRIAFNPVDGSKTEHNYDLGLPYPTEEEEVKVFDGIPYKAVKDAEGNVMSYDKIPGVEAKEEEKKAPTTKTIGGKLYEWNSETEDWEFTGIEEEKEPEADWSQGRQFIDDNPDASYEELLAGLQEQTDLKDSELKSLLASKGKKPTEEVEEEKEFLTREWFIENFGEEALIKKAKEEGYGKLFQKAKTEMNKYLDDLMKGVIARRAAGMTDQEILKAMK